MKITQALMDELTAQAKASPRLRMNYDLRNSSEDQSQRMLNAMEPGTVMPIHRHQKTSETMVILRGCLVEEFYDELERVCTERDVSWRTCRGTEHPCGAMAFIASDRERDSDSRDEGWSV